MKQNDATTDLDVIIVGAGWSGLLACKYCCSQGLKTLVLESRNTVGGVWAYTDEQRFGGVMKTTQTTSSKCITEISDFPMPATYPDFPGHAQIYDYLKSYCAHFGLNDHIHLGQGVTNVARHNGAWQLKCADGSEFSSSNLIVSSGVHQYPNDVTSEARFEGYTGIIQHSASIKQLPPDYADKVIIVWGGGESASDVAFEASKLARRVYMCIPNGQWFVPKVVDHWPPFPSSQPKVVDHTSSRVRLFLSPTHFYSPFISQYLEYVFGFNGHGQEPWRTEAPYNRSFFNKSSEVLSRVASGHVVPKRDIDHCHGDTVFFTDGSAARADVIVTCAGYRTCFPFFEGTLSRAVDLQEWYKYIFYDDDPSLAFVGFVRPIFGSIPGLAELQSRYVAQIFAGRRELPSLTERRRIIRRDKEFWNSHFRHTSLRLVGLVDHFLYSDQLAKLIGCRPAFWKLLLGSPGKWWNAIMAPWNGCQFWLADKTQHKRIFETFARYDNNRISESYTFILLAPLLPVIGLFTHIRLFLKDHFFRKELQQSRSI